MARTLQDLLTIPTPQIVIAENYDGHLGQVRAEDALAARIEAVAVDQGEHRLLRHGCARCWLSPPRLRARRLPRCSEPDISGFPIAG